jgi:hypothetical protein
MPAMIAAKLELREQIRIVGLIALHDEAVL